jgi:LCP family protein required for cell wall assembly
VSTTSEDAGGWGPTVGGRSRRRLPLRVLVWVLVVLLVTITALGLWVTSRIPREPVDGLAGSGSPLHVLVVGSDSREGLTEDDQRDLTIGRDEGGERTDTIFLMTIDGGRVGLLAFPRDLWVPRCDGSTGRINVAQQIGGPSCLVTTVRELSGIDVQHYVRVTFGGFRDVVDAVGGVEICLDEPIADRDAGIDLPSGCQELDGTDALGYVRVRKIDDDLRRIQRQQTFLRALASEVAAPSTALNPVRMLRLGDEVGGAITINEGFGPLSMLRFARGARGLATGAAVTETVPATVGAAGDASVLFVDEAAAAPIFASFADGSVLDDAEGGAEAIDPADVPVRVLNGAGVSGLAGQVGQLLEGRGYPVLEVGNTDTRSGTLIRHPRAQRIGAHRLAGEVPGGAQLEETTEVTDVTILLGSDAAGRS